MVTEMRTTSRTGTVNVHGPALRELRLRQPNPDIEDLALRVRCNRSTLAKLELGHNKRASARLFNALCAELAVHDRRVLMADPYSVPALTEAAG